MTDLERCEDCGRSFISEDALRKHQTAPEADTAPVESHDSSGRTCATVRSREVDADQ